LKGIYTYSIFCKHFATDKRLVYLLLGHLIVKCALINIFKLTCMERVFSKCEFIDSWKQNYTDTSKQTHVTGHGKTLGSLLL